MQIIDYPNVFPTIGRADLTNGNNAENKFPPCFIDFRICVLDIFISSPVPLLIAYFILFISVFVNIISSIPFKLFLESLIVTAELFFVAFVSFSFCPIHNFKL